MAIVGYSVLEFDGEDISLLNSGSIKTSKTHTESQRLLEIFEDITTIIERYKPDIASVEKLFFFKKFSAIDFSFRIRKLLIEYVFSTNFLSHAYPLFH